MAVEAYNYQTWKQMEINDYSFRNWDDEDLKKNSSAKSTKESFFKKFYNNSKDSVKNMVGKGKATFEKIKEKITNNKLVQWGMNNKYINAGAKFLNIGLKIAGRVIDAKNGLEKGEEVSDLRTTQADRIHGKDNIRDEAIKTGAKIGGVVGSVLGGLTKLTPYGFFTLATGYDPITDATGYAGAEAGAAAGEVIAVTTEEIAKKGISGYYDEMINYYSHWFD